MFDLFAFMSTVYPHHANTNSKDCNCNCLVSCSISVLKTESHWASLFSKQRQGNERKEPVLLSPMEILPEGSEEIQKSNHFKEEKTIAFNKNAPIYLLHAFHIPSTGADPLTWDISFKFSHTDPMSVSVLTAPSVQMWKLRSEEWNLLKSTQFVDAELGFGMETALPKLLHTARTNGGLCLGNEYWNT